jgi:TP901 family phage tail tape measure protein
MALSELNVGVKFTSYFAGFTTGIIAAKNNVSALSDKIKALNTTQFRLKELTNLNGEVTRLTDKLNTTKQALTNANTEFKKFASEGNSVGVEKYSKKIEQLTRVIDKDTNQLNTAKQAVIAHSNELSKQNINLNQLDSELNRVSNSIKTYQIQQRQASVFDKARSSTLAALRDEQVKLASTMAIVGLSIKKSVEFESAMADVRKVVNFDTPQQFKEMGNDIQSLAGKLPLTAEGIAKIIASGGQAGFARKELLKFAEDAGKMGVAFDTSADEAGQMMAQWRTSFKMGQEQVVALADQINYLGNTGPANAGKISEIVTRIGPLGEVAGVASGQIAALGSTVAGMGIAPEIAATGIKNLMLSLVAGESATKAQKAQFEQLGISATEMAKRMQTDASGAITDVLTRISHLSKEKQAAALDNLFGKESIGAIAPLLTNLDLLTKNLHKVGDANQYAGSMQKEFQSRADTSANSFQLLGNTLNRIRTIIGNQFTPILEKGAKALTNIGQSIADFADKHEHATAAVTYAAAGFLTYKSVVLLASLANTAFASSLFKMTGLTGIRTALMALIPAFSGAGAASGLLGTGLTLAAIPLAPILIGIGALAVAGALLYKFWQPISAFFSGFFTGLMDGLAPIGSAFSAAFSPVIPIISAVSDILSGLFTWLGQLLTPIQLTTDGFNQASSAGAAVGYAIGTMVSWIAGLVGWLFKIPMNILGSVFEFGKWIGEKLGLDKLGQALGGMLADNTDASNATKQAAAKAAVTQATKTTAAAAGTTTNTQTVNMTVNAAPGMDEKAIAAQVKSQLEAAERQKQSKARSGMKDKE